MSQLGSVWRLGRAGPYYYRYYLSTPGGAAGLNRSLRPEARPAHGGGPGWASRLGVVGPVGNATVQDICAINK